MKYKMDGNHVPSAMQWGRLRHGSFELPVTIGDGTDVWGAVMRDAVVGDNCTIGQGAHVGRNVVVGNGCKIQNGAQLFEGVTLEDDVFVGPGAVFTNVMTPRAFVNRRDHFQKTLVKRGASIGANATILCGITIGEYALVGAGSVVTRDVAPHAIVVGNPAEHRKWACRCGEVLGHDSNVFLCSVCGNRYRVDDSNTITLVEENPPDGKGATP